jgi:hypothetical protein
MYDQLIMRLGDMLAEWSAADPERQKVVAALSQQMAARCDGLPAEDPGQLACAAFAKSPAA